MFKYLMTSAALKMFSISPQTKRFYRLLGNIVDQRRRIREGLNEYYVDRARKILELYERHYTFQKGNRLLEIGTGWMHWESIIIRLFYDVEITMFDVWDNRYFGAFKQYFGQLERIIDGEIDMDQAQHKRVHALLQAISKASSFDEIYNLFGLQYVINQSGTLSHFQDESFSVIFSCDVLEHIDRSLLPEFIQDFHRLLKPGGYSLHKIDLIDHLYYYDTSVSVKNYLRYPDKVWKRFFENSVQYINRIQRPEWLDFFHKAELELIEEQPIFADLDTIKVDESYKTLSRQDLECVTLTVVHRKAC